MSTRARACTQETLWQFSDTDSEREFIQLHMGGPWHRPVGFGGEGGVGGGDAQEGRAEAFAPYRCAHPLCLFLWLLLVMFINRPGGDLYYFGSPLFVWDIGPNDSNIDGDPGYG